MEVGLQHRGPARIAVLFVQSMSLAPFLPGCYSI